MAGLLGLGQAKGKASRPSPAAPPPDAVPDGCGGFTATCWQGNSLVVDRYDGTGRWVGTSITDAGGTITTTTYDIDDEGHLHRHD
jgi:hypothetical protein